MAVKKMHLDRLSSLLFAFKAVNDAENIGNKNSNLFFV